MPARDVGPNEAWLAIRVTKEARDELKAWAASEDRSVSWIVRQLILDTLAARAQARRDAPGQRRAEDA